MKKNDFDKSVIKYMHEMSMPVLYKTKFWYKTSIDTPSLVSAAPQEDLIYWQEWQKTHTKQTTKHRHIPFHSFSSQFILFYYFNWPDNHYHWNTFRLHWLLIFLISTWIFFFFQVNLLDTLPYLYFIPTPRKTLELNYHCFRITSF